MDLKGLLTWSPVMFVFGLICTPVLVAIADVVKRDPTPFIVVVCLFASMVIIGLVIEKFKTARVSSVAE
jgi:hypothetical protein